MPTIPIEYVPKIGVYQWNTGDGMSSASVVARDSTLFWGENEKLENEFDGILSGGNR